MKAFIEIAKHYRKKYEDTFLFHSMLVLPRRLDVSNAIEKYINFKKSKS